MHVFLTGGTGFIGIPLVGALRQRGWSVTALVRDQQSRAAQSLVQLGATLAPGDITDRESMRAPMTGADLVIHNAAWYEVGIGGGGADRRMQTINVEGTRNAGRPRQPRHITAPVCARLCAGADHRRRFSALPGLRR